MKSLFSHKWIEGKIYLKYLVPALALFGFVRPLDFSAMNISMATLVGVIVIRIGGKDAIYKEHILLNSLPVERWKIVALDYLHSLIQILLLMTAYVAISNLFSYISLNRQLYWPDFVDILATISSLIIVLGLALPFYFKLIERGGIGKQFIGYFLGIILVTSLSEFFKRKYLCLTSSSVHFWLRLLIVILMFYLGSFGISLKLYKQREF